MLENNEPPGAVGGLYGSGCFHFCNSFSVSVKRILCTSQLRFVVLQEFIVSLLFAVWGRGRFCSHRIRIECILPVLATGFFVLPSRGRVSVSVGKATFKCLSVLQLGWLVVESST